MALQSELERTSGQESVSGRFALTIVLRKHDEDDQTYFVAECLELPGCISQGDTEEEAKANVEEALELCLSVMFEDCVKQAMARHRTPDLTGITSQELVNVTTMPQLEYA